VKQEETYDWCEPDWVPTDVFSLPIHIIPAPTSSAKCQLCRGKIKKGANKISYSDVNAFNPGLGYTFKSICDVCGIILLSGYITELKGDEEEDHIWQQKRK
jgi:hypothetical protein